MPRRTWNRVVFLLDVDNTLLDNDRVVADLMRTSKAVGAERQQRYWAIFEELRDRARLRRLPGGAAALPGRAPARSASARGVVFPRQLSVRQSPVSGIARRHRAPARLGADGHPLRRRRRVSAAQGRALRACSRPSSGTSSSTSTRSTSSTTSSAAIPADHYVLVDDKLRILAAVKKVWGARVTTVFPRQGHYAPDPGVATYPPPT